MSHIDAKAETKGVEAMEEDLETRKPLAALPASEVIEWLSDRAQNCQRLAVLSKPSDAEGWIDDMRFLSNAISLIQSQVTEPQRHARINCNGKSCGEFNCDTCHPQEGEPTLSDIEEAKQYLKAKESLHAKFGFVPSADDPKKCACAYCRRDAEALADMCCEYEMQMFLEGGWKDRAEEAEVELAALKATPKEGWAEYYKEAYRRTLESERRLLLRLEAVESRPIPCQECEGPMQWKLVCTHCGNKTEYEPTNGHELESRSCTDVNGAGVYTEYWRECVRCHETFGEHDLITPCKKSLMPTRPKLQGGDYRPHYRQDETDRYIAALESKIAAQPSPSLSLEEPEQLVNQLGEALERYVHQANGAPDRYTGTGISRKVIIATDVLKDHNDLLQQWRALAARRGGK